MLTKKSDQGVLETSVGFFFFGTLPALTLGHVFVIDNETVVVCLAVFQIPNISKLTWLPPSLTRLTDSSRTWGRRNYPASTYLLSACFITKSWGFLRTFQNLLRNLFKVYVLSSPQFTTTWGLIWHKAVQIDTHRTKSKGVSAVLYEASRELIRSLSCIAP